MTKVLLVEDNEMNRDMLSRRLIRRGFEVVFAVDGKQGVEAARREKPDIILMDMSLPVMDGWEATRCVKSDDATRGVPVIGLTARAMSGDREKAMEAGCDDYDTKPVELDRLIGKIERLLGLGKDRACSAHSRASGNAERDSLGSVDTSRSRFRGDERIAAHGGVLLKPDLDERLNRALTAFLRQEVQAPATAVTDFLDMIIEDARTAQAENLLADLNRMRSASVQLNAFVKNLIQDSSSDRRQDDETLEAFHRRLRHDLRTPLNAIKGYSELLIEDLEAAGAHPLLADLAKLKASADQLLEQIDAMTALARQKQAEPVELAKVRQLDVVADVLRSLEPLPAGATAQGALHSSRILVVDDNASNRDVLERRLTREGHQVACAANGAAALELVVRQEFDLILLDLIMPEMSGFEVLRRLKAAEHTNHIPVIVISALDDLDSAVRCIEAGAEDYLTKPFNPILLRARIGASLERKWLHDREKKFVADLEREKERSEALLLNILPQGIVNRMRSGETAIADQVAAATILFCDVVGFTTLSEGLTPDRTIDFLSRIFSAFDRLAAEFKVEKIKTIGDAYMVAAGIPEAQSDHADRIAALAPRMLEAVAAVAEATGLKLQARIGIHTGPIVAGVIGAHKFVYDVWGDTVNTASRMQSHSRPGRIQISAATRHALGGRFKLERRGIIKVKGKGAMETYFLNDW